MHSDQSLDARIDQEAAEWLIDIKDTELWYEDRTKPESFLNWLTQSKRHRDAFFDVACAWRKLDVFGKGQVTSSRESAIRSAK